MPLLLNRIHELGQLIPEAPAVAFVDERGNVTESMSRADVVHDMAEMAAFLRLHCGLAPGDRALLVYPPGLEFMRALVGCLAAGIVPAPVYPPDPINAHNSIEGFAKIAADCTANAVLTSREYAAIRELGAAKSSMNSPVVQWPTGPDWHITSREATRLVEREMNSSPGSAAELWVPTSETPAFLQYTSGSTSDPKGVVVTHGNLAHQLDFLRRSLGFSLDSRIASWLPQYHDMGLIGTLLSALYGNATVTMMSPLSFLQRPALWFEVMHRVRATHTTAPNFAYELAVRKTTAGQRAQWDLSSLEVMMTAAEPVRDTTTHRFLEAFAVCGLRPEVFCPAYGLAEHTLAVTVWGRSSLRVDRRQLEMDRLAVAAEGPDTQVLMSCGELNDDVEVRIVDPELGVPLSEGQVGEIWLDSPSKAAGYWGNPEATRATFQARLAGDDGGRGYLCTGDLGFVHHGELYVSGRIKDLLVLAGRNIHPQDIEDSLRDCHGAIKPGGIVAFAIDDHDSEALAMLLEVRTGTPPAVLPGVVEAVRTVVLKHHQLRCAVVVVGPPGSVSKTTSGKLQRSRCRARLLDGSLEAQALLVDRFAKTQPVPAGLSTAVEHASIGPIGPVITSMEQAPSRSANELLDSVREQVAAILGIGFDAIDVTKPLGEQGLNSIGVVELATRLSQVLDRNVPAVDVFNHPSVEALTRLLGRTDRFLLDRPQQARWGRYAVIGAGCAGLAAVSQLIEQGAAEVVLFEANDRVGGKILSCTDEHGRTVELGQAGFSCKYERSLQMAGRLGLELISRGTGSDRARERRRPPAARSWRRVARGNHLEPSSIDRRRHRRTNPLAELRKRPGLGCGIDNWCREQGLPAAPLVWRHWWTGFGYGPFDDTTPAAYLVALASLTDDVMDGTPTTLAGLCVKGGNDRLWTTELDVLQATGLCIGGLRARWRSCR